MRSMPGWSRATTATLTPLAASTRHVAAPIPLEPPVTTATLPARSGYVGIIAFINSGISSRCSQLVQVDGATRWLALQRTCDLLGHPSLQVVLRLGGVERCMGGDQRQRMRAQWVIAGQGFGLGDVQRDASEPAVVERPRHRVEVHKTASRRVHEHRTPPHLRNALV